jgi:hypothetical protein
MGDFSTPFPGIVEADRDPAAGSAWKIESAGCLGARRRFYIISTSLRGGSMQDGEDSVEFIDSK